LDVVANLRSLVSARESDEHESWYINMGIVTKAFLDPHQMQNLSH